MTDIYTYLKQHNIAYTEYLHPAVFTCAESEELSPPMPGADTKNLFLKADKEAQYFLVTVPHTKRVHLKSLAQLLGVKKLSFGNEEELMKYVGVLPGSVTVLGLIHDLHHSVVCVIDSSVWGHESIQCHPLINTATLVIPHEGLQTFLHSTGHNPFIVDVPTIT